MNSCRTDRQERDVLIFVGGVLTDGMKLFGMLLGVSVVGLTATSAHRSASRAVLPCVSPGTGGQITVQALKLELGRPDSAAIRFRNVFGVAGVDSSTVTVVTDTIVCTRIHQVVDSAFHISPTTTSSYLVVLRVGPRFISFSPRGPSSSAWYITDTNYVWKHFVP